MDISALPMPLWDDIYVEWLDSSRTLLTEFVDVERDRLLAMFMLVDKVTVN